MLVLTRRLNESVKLGREGEITIKVLELKRNYVRLGIDAPKAVSIHREEVFLRIKAESDYVSPEQALDIVSPIIA